VELGTLGLIVNEGRIIDASFVEVPGQRNSREDNRKKSGKRARVEHIFGFMEMSMNGMYVHVIGKARVHAINGLMNLTYNMFRSIQLQAA
jgi:IS5 family transposase